MNTNKLKLTLGVMCGLLFLPVVSQASSATMLSDTTALFTINFTASDTLFDQEIPIAADFGITYLDRTDMVGYTIESEVPATPAVTNINALVLSTSTIAGTRYQVEKGSNASFTLFILATFAEPLTSDYRARITKLPYFIEGRRTTVHQNQLDELPMPILRQEK